MALRSIMITEEVERQNVFALQSNHLFEINVGPSWPLFPMYLYVSNSFFFFLFNGYILHTVLQPIFLTLISVSMSGYIGILCTRGGLEFTFLLIGTFL